MKDKLTLFMPESYDLVVGDTFQLFYRGIIQSYNPYQYQIVATCEKGKSFPRYFEYTPKEAGRHLLDISVYDDNLNIIGNAKTILNVVSPKASDKPVNFLCIGASLDSDGQWVNELNRRITSNDGTPRGLGFGGLNFIGTSKQGDVSVEAYGGWQWNNFTSTKEGAVWIEYPNKFTSEDQHSIWKDENGALWQIETLQVDYLKLNKYLYHDCSLPKSGTLYHVKNALHQEPIKYNSSTPGKISPFYDAETGTLDFKKYLKKQGFDRVDVVYANLGGNGLMRTDAQSLSREEYCKIVVKEAKEVVDLILDACPDAKIKLMTMLSPSSKGGLGTNYGAEPPFNNYLNLVNYHIELCKAYQSWCKEDKYKNNLELVHMSGQFDSENNYPYIEKRVNSRCPTTERLDTNGVHPAPCGYLQMADAIYRNLVKEFYSEKND